MTDLEGGGSAPPGLHRLARLYGIQTRYRDDAGDWRVARPEALRAALAAMGVEARTPAQIAGAAGARGEELRSRLVEPVTATRLERSDVPPTVHLRLPSSWSGGVADCTLRTEAGRVLEWKTGPDVGGAHDGGARARIRLPAPLPPGYHELTVRAGGLSATTLVVAAPSKSWRPATPDGSPRQWGVFLPLYALRSEESWGVGDLRDLERLLEWTERLGGDVVGTLPLLAGAERGPADARVYNPVSRLFWNEAYLHVEGAPGLGSSPEARRILGSPDFLSETRALRDADLVDWKGAVESKRRVLEPLARDFLGEGLPSAVASFLEACPDAERYARFRAEWEERGEPWGTWPEGRVDGRPGSTPPDSPAFRYHLYVQWLADRQMRTLRERRGAGEAGLYLDLPLGCDPDGFDVWRYRKLFARGVSVGSPPDAFFSEGQNWGFPPIRPEEMIRSGVDYTRASLRHHMRFAARLRLDHVMSLHRLFWIPDGMTALDGVYVRYPHDVLYAVLCIESHRHRTAVVGEDLGTVPREVRRAMARHGVERMYVAQFEARAGGSPALPPPPPRSVASLGTHDTATFAGFWSAADAELRVELGLLEPEEAEAERAGREALRVAWVRDLREEADLDPGSGEAGPAPVLRGTLRRLVRSRASLLLVNLEDLWLEERPQNVPGTGPERPNFRRKARYDLEELTTLEAVLEPLREVDALRGSAPSPDAEPGPPTRDARSGGTAER